MDKNLIPQDAIKELDYSYFFYAKSVICNRAIPHYYDGFKTSTS